MAKLGVFVICDVKAGMFYPPSVSNTRYEAVRTFTDVVNDRSLPFVKHPEDYRLFYIGDYDNVSGQIDGCTPEFVASASDLVPTNGGV